MSTCKKNTEYWIKKVCNSRYVITLPWFNTNWIQTAVITIEYPSTRFDLLAAPLASVKEPIIIGY